MSNNDERDSVTLVWKIENFNIDWEGVIESPVFLLHSLENTEWRMKLDPQGKENHISLELTRCGLEDNGTERIVVDCKLAIVDNKGSPLKWMEIDNRGFRRNHFWLCQRFIERTEVFYSRKDDYLPRDTLTVNCRLWKSFNEDTESEVHLSRTKIEKICFDWTINDFSGLKTYHRKRLHVKKADSIPSFLTFDFVLVEKGQIEIEITSKECKKLHFLCYISLIDSYGRVFKNDRWWYTFELPLSDWNPEKLVWGPHVSRLLFLNKGFPCSNKNLYLPMGALSMQVEFFFWTGDVESNNGIIKKSQSFQVIDETKIGAPLLSVPKVGEKVCGTEADSMKYAPDFQNRFMHDMQCMFEEGILSDFTLRASGKEFHVHKNILSARSPVFRAMFTTEMKEKKDNFAEIPDVDSDTLQKMLLFVYSNKLEEGMTWESTMNLYFAADKYAIEDLKHASCSLLKEGLCVSNACDILVHSDLHGDQDLKATTKDFIIDNDSEIIGSDDWNKMLKSHIHLTVEIFSELYMKKMKKM